MKALYTLLVVLASATCFAQETKSDIGQVVFWKPLHLNGSLFESGYKQHLAWHSKSGDTWSWYGWTIQSGPRAGQFVDATFDHTWADFDKAVSPAEDRIDNQLHVNPFGEVQAVFKVKYHLLGQHEVRKLQMKVIRMITFTLKSPSTARDVLAIIDDCLRSLSLGGASVFTVVDGGDLHQMVIMIPFPDFEEFGKSENFPALLASKANKPGKETMMDGFFSETMIYRPDLSLIQQK